MALPKPGRSSKIPVDKGRHDASLEESASEDEEQEQFGGNQRQSGNLKDTTVGPEPPAGARKSRPQLLDRTKSILPYETNIYPEAPEREEDEEYPPHEEVYDHPLAKEAPVMLKGLRHEQYNGMEGKIIEYVEKDDRYIVFFTKLARPMAVKKKHVFRLTQTRETDSRPDVARRTRKPREPGISDEIPRHLDRRARPESTPVAALKTNVDRAKRNLERTVSGGSGHATDESFDS